jgi:hypothetical protein
MEERRSVEQDGYDAGPCRCDDWDPPEPLPGEDQSIRRLLKALEQELETYEPTEATKKFGDDLKDGDKEYRGVAEVVSKYETFYDDKLYTMLAKARSWRKDLNEWCEGGVGAATREAIKELRQSGYDAVERRHCCHALEYGDKLVHLYDCLAQSRKKEEEAGADYKEYKEFEKGLTDRFAELESLYKQAEAYRDKQRHKAVCALAIEYAEVYRGLGAVRTREYWRRKCHGGDDYAPEGDGEEPEQEEYYEGAEGEYQQTPPKGQPPYKGRQPPPQQGGHKAHKPDLKKQWPPDKFRTELIKALRRLILSKYQRFRWQQKWLEVETEGKKAKEACDKFRKGRREEFVQEAEDIEAGEAAEG